jgi:hypothetical protein
MTRPMCRFPNRTDVGQSVDYRLNSGRVTFTEVFTVIPVELHSWILAQTSAVRINSGFEITYSG